MDSHSIPAAWIHSSTAAASSVRMLRILSSAFGERRSKLSQASKRIAEGEVDPGRNTDTEDAVPKQSLKRTPVERKPRTRNLLDKITDVRAQYSNTVYFCDSKGSSGVEVSGFDQRPVKFLSCCTHCSVSPNGPTSTASESQVTRIASLPHHST